MRTTTVGQVVEDLVAAYRRSRPRHGQPRTGCSVCLLGAGCSVTAGIPLADEIADQIWHEFEGTENEADVGYAGMMHSLDPVQRHEVFQRWVGASRLNWAHVALGYLVHRRVVGRLLTTNFDDLIARGCALFGEHPTTHDLGALARFARKGVKSYYTTYDVREPSLLYLHGRHNGFWQIHNRRETKEQAEALGSVIDRHAERVWIVVGYSGENDDLRDQLAPVAAKCKALFWVNRSAPSAEVRRALRLDRSRSVHFVECGADEFFTELARTFSTEPGRGARARAGGRASASQWMRLPTAFAEQVFEQLPPMNGVGRRRGAARGTTKAKSRPVGRRHRSLSKIEQIAERVRTELRAHREARAAEILSREATAAIERGERELARGRTAAAQSAFESCMALTDTSATATRCDGLLATSTDRDAGEALAIENRFRRLQLRNVERHARAVLGSVIARVLREESDEVLKGVKDGVAGHRLLQRQPALLMALALVHAVRAVQPERPAQGRSKFVRDASKEIEQAVKACAGLDPKAVRRLRTGLRSANAAMAAGDLEQLRGALSRSLTAAGAALQLPALTACAPACLACR